MIVRGRGLQARAPPADHDLVDRRVLWLFVVVGSTIGGFLPAVWGGSVLGPASLGLGCLGALVGLWLAVRLTG